MFNDDAVLTMIYEECLKTPQVQKVYLFGSRAKGTARATSDYDLAFVLHGDALWAQFAENLREKNPLLNQLDLVRLGEKTTPELKERILKEGKLIYEKK